VALLACAWALVLRRVTRVGLLALGVLAYLPLLLGGFVIYFFSAYGLYFLQRVEGLSGPATLLLVEGAAVVLEGVFLWLFTRRALSLPMSLGVCTIANAVSFALGWVLLR
jgi:hypothetical protein